LVHTDDEQLLIGVAERLKIHPAIVAGRVRWETQDYRRFSSLVGHGKVHPQFSE
jgi:HTH-type transcriptional regulator/antitoxin HigA